MIIFQFIISFLSFIHEELELERAAPKYSYFNQ